MIKNISYFGDVDVAQMNGYFSHEIKLSDQFIELILLFDDVPESDDWVSNYENYVDRIIKYKDKIEKAILLDFKNDGPVFEYINNYLDNLSESICNNAGVEDESIDAKKLLRRLKLSSISFIFDEEESFATWSYSFDEDNMNYSSLLINTDRRAKILDLMIDK